MSSTILSRAPEADSHLMFGDLCWDLFHTRQNEAFSQLGQDEHASGGRWSHTRGGLVPAQLA